MKVVNGECPGGWSRRSPGARGTRCGQRGRAGLRHPEVPATLPDSDKRRSVAPQPPAPRHRTGRLPVGDTPQLQGSDS